MPSACARALRRADGRTDTQVPCSATNSWPSTLKSTRPESTAYISSCPSAASVCSLMTSSPVSASQAATPNASMPSRVRTGLKRSPP